jgi:peptidyl-prolyl cis-trans isomerase SurA
MKQALKLFVFITFLLSTGISHGRTMDRILATVGDEVITFADYRQYAKVAADEGGNSETVNEKLLKRLIESRIIFQEAKRKGIEASAAEVDRKIDEFKEKNRLSQEDVERFLKEEGMDIKSYRARIKDEVISSKLVDENIGSKVVVIDKEISDYYKANLKEFLSSPEKVELKAIFIKLREEASLTEITDLKLRALKMAAQLHEVDNFDILAEEISDEPLRSHGGLLGSFAKGALVPALDNKAFSMKEGEISEPVWVSEGVYILKRIGRSTEIIKPFDEVRGEIKSYLYTRKREKMFNEWMKVLWERASVIIKQD